VFDIYMTGGRSCSSLASSYGPLSALASRQCVYVCRSVYFRSCRTCRLLVSMYVGPVASRPPQSFEFNVMFVSAEVTKSCVPLRSALLQFGENVFNDLFFTARGTLQLVNITICAHVELL
jgi:hypothetical protein